MKITEIQVRNFKGITNKDLRFDNLIPNSMHLFIAPNGFGKTSLARSFQSLKRGKLELIEENFHNNSAVTNQSLTVQWEINGQPLSATADQNSNTISDNFETAVINSKLKVKAIRSHGPRAPRAKIVHDDYQILKKIPPATYQVPTNLAVMGRSFPIYRTLFQNIHHFFESQILFTIFLYNYSDQTRYEKPTQTKILDKIQTELIKPTTTFDLTTIEGIISGNQYINDIYLRLKEIATTSPYEPICLLYQITNLLRTNRANFNKGLERILYVYWRDNINSTLTGMNTALYNIPRLSETRDDGLVFILENVADLSSGQKDAASFIAQLYKAQYDLFINSNKENSILIIDEIFDFLDDANLVVAKYYILKMIKFAKQLKKSFFPIILTHLAPREFSQYQTNGLKQHFLDPRTSEYKDNDLRKIIHRRSSIADTEPDYVLISKFYVHFNPTANTLSPNCGLPQTFTGTTAFKANLASQYNNYKNQRNDFDPFAICAYLRIKIEEKVYSKLPAQHQNEFINTYKTVDKLNYAETCGVAIPDTFFLLSLIYNDALHCKNNQFKFLESKLTSQLKNQILKSMIHETLEQEI